MNDLTSTGLFAVPPGVSNSPHNDWNAVIVMRVDGNVNFIVQVALCIQRRIYIRNKWDGTWNDWKAIIPS